jgi:L-serine deaminase
MELADDIKELAGNYAQQVIHAIHDGRDQGITDHFQLTLFVHAALMDYMIRIEREAATDANFDDIAAYVNEVVNDTYEKGFEDGHSSGMEDAYQDADEMRERLSGMRERP